MKNVYKSFSLHITVLEELHIIDLLKKNIENDFIKARLNSRHVIH